MGCCQSSATEDAALAENSQRLGRSGNRPSRYASNFGAAVATEGDSEPSLASEIAEQDLGITLCSAATSDSYAPRRTPRRSDIGSPTDPLPTPQELGPRAVRAWVDTVRSPAPMSAPSAVEQVTP